MYKIKSFESPRAMVDYLNKHKIPKENIVSIFQAKGRGVIDLIYVAEIEDNF